MKKFCTLIILWFSLYTSSLFAQCEFLGLGDNLVEVLQINNDYLYAGTDNGIYKKNISTSDTLWAHIGLDNNSIKALLVINNDTIFTSIKIIENESDTISIYHTVDGGLNWIPYQNGFGGDFSKQVHALCKSSYLPDLIYATGFAVIAKSYDFGLSWQQVWGNWNAGGMGTHFIKEDQNSSNIFWAGGESGYLQPYILKSYDYGSTWQENWINVGGDNACYCIAIHPQNSDIVYVGMEGRIIKSVDGGNNWNTILTPSSYPYFYGLAISPYNPSIIYATGAYHIGVTQYLELYISEDEGNSWVLNTLGEPGQNGIRDLQLVNNNNVDILFLTAGGNGVYKYTNEILNNQNTIDIFPEKSAILYNNYPNPFNPSTKIEFSIKKNSEIELSIYNTKGQKLRTLAQNYFPEGSHSIVWNGDDESNKPVSSGVYLYKLNVNGKTESVKKCLLLK